MSAAGDPRPEARPEPAIGFFDAAMVRWRVEERDARHDAGSRAEWCLVFMSIDAVRRVWSYPADWRAMSADELVTLSRGR